MNKFIWLQLFTVSILVCGCAGGGYYATPLPDFAIDNEAASLPTYEPQNVWVRTLGQPDQLVTVLPAY